MRQKILVLTTSLLAGLAVGGVVVANAEPHFSFSGLRFGGSSKFLPDSTDSGVAQQIADVKHELPKLFEGNIELGNLSPNDRHSQYFGDQSAENYKKLLRRIKAVWASADSENYLGEFKKVFAEDDQYQMDRSFQKVTFVVDQWQGVQTDGDSANALLLAHYEYMEGGKTRTEAQIQWNVGLIFEDNQWKLKSRESVSNE
jgi:hypothetical protein